jgi:hypothetical protein
MIETLYVWTDDRDGALGDIFPEVVLSPEDWLGGSLFEPDGVGFNVVEICPN